MSGAAVPRYLQLDVFAERAGGGNPLGVVIGAAGWANAQMQAFAAWTGLVETTFVLPPASPEADYRLRIFTPQREIPFAGHPSIGSAQAAVVAGAVATDRSTLIQECGAGLVPIRGAGADRTRPLYFKAPPAEVRIGQSAHLREVLSGLPLGCLPPALVAGGRRWWVVELDGEAVLRQWRPHHAAIAALAASSDTLGLCVFARCTGPDYQLAVRALPCGIGIDEDPASGAANSLIAAYLHAAEPEGPLAKGYRVSQGREIGRDASLLVEYDSDGAIWVGGRCHVVIDGSLDWTLPA